MHPFLFQFGQFRLPTYGVIALCALGIAVLLIRRYARIEGLDPGATSEAIVLTLAVGFFGARLFEAVVNWDRYFGRPDGWKDLRFATGVFFGGLLTAIPFGIYWFRRTGIPVLVGLDLLALTGCIAEGVGRWGCFFSGCCWGTPTQRPWAVTFPDAARRLHPGLPDVPLHPTQVYMSLISLSILSVLLLLYRKKRFDGQIISVYVVLYAVTRFFIEFVRGDAERGFVFGGRLSTSQAVAPVVALAGIVAGVILARRHRRSILALAILLFLLPGAPVHAAASGFRLRIVELGGDPARAATLEHVKYCRGLGFNALLVHSREAGVWTKEQAPEGPRLNPNFLNLAKWCRRHGMELWVSIDPIADSGAAFSYQDEGIVNRWLAFAALLRDQADVRRMVLSFDDQPAQLTDLSDIFRFGAGAATPQVEFARRLKAVLPGDVTTWLLASVDSDAQLGDGTSPEAKAFLDGIGSLPAGMGFVWAGPERRSLTITRASLEASRARLGNRPLLLMDPYPENDNDEDDAMALIMGAIRGREAGIQDVVSGYVARPAFPLAGSRLSLLTIADFLRDPATYDPAVSAAAAVSRLAGRNPEARTALTTQQLEWGGFFDGRNYWPRDEMNPDAVAHRLNDPGFIMTFTWTVERYPSRMASLALIADHPFRDELLRTMRRRLAIARAMPLAIDYLSRMRGGRPGGDGVLARIDLERRSWLGDADAERSLETFLRAATIPLSELAP